LGPHTTPSVTGTARPFESEPVFVAVDGSLHSSRCYRDDGSLGCAWPEQHEAGFIDVVAFPPIDIDLLSPWSRPPSEPKPRVKELPAITSTSVRTISEGLVTALMLIAGIVGLAAGSLMFAGGYSLNDVTSGSMRPGLAPGDLVVLQKVQAVNLHVGDVIAYTPPGKSEALIHRIVSITHEPNGVVLAQTRGDANNVNDAGPVQLSNVSYRLTASVPLLGWATVMRGYIWLAMFAVLGLMALLWLKGVMLVRIRRLPGASGASIASRRRQLF
jgi:signal peptidase I